MRGPYLDWIQNFQSGPLSHIIVKLADICDNVSPARPHKDASRRARSKYLPAAKILLDRLPASDVKAKVAAYFAKVADLYGLPDIYTCSDKPFTEPKDRNNEP